MKKRKQSIGYEALAEALAVGVLHGLRGTGEVGGRMAVVLHAVAQCLGEIYEDEELTQRLLVDVATKVADEGIRAAGPADKKVMDGLKKDLSMFRDRT
jgi:hypothetical protein